MASASNKSSSGALSFNSWVIALASGVGFTNAIVSVAISPLAARQLAVGDSFASIPQGFQLLMGTVAVILFSWLTGIIGRKRVFLSAAVLGIIGGLCGVWAMLGGGIWALMLSSCLVGLQLGGNALYRYAIIEVTKREVHARAVSLVVLGSIIGAALGPYVVRNAPTIFGSDIYQGAYIFITLNSLAVAIILFFAKFAVIERRPYSPWLRKVLSIRGLSPAVVNGAGVYGIMSGLMVASSLAMRARGFDYSLISYVIQLHVVCMFLPSVFTGRLIAFLGVRGVMLLGVMSLASALFVALFDESFLGFLVSLAFLGVSWNFIYVCASYVIGERSQEASHASYKLKTQGFSDTIIIASSGLSALGSGHLLHLIGWHNMQYVGLFILGIMLLFGKGLIYGRSIGLTQTAKATS